MINTILVPVVGDGSDSRVFSTAFSTARLFDAHLEFLLVRTDPLAVIAAAASGDVGGALSIPDLLADLQKVDQERAARARRSFETFCTRQGITLAEDPPGGDGVSAAWHEQKGDEAEIVARQLRFHDLLVSCPSGEKDGPAPQTIETALMEGGRPILLAAGEQPASLVETVVIAWKDGPEAARAVTAAMPFLAAASKLVVVTIGETDDDRSSSVEGVARLLHWHRFKVEVRRVAPDQEPAPLRLMKEARKANADLIVMGGYGHSRLREMIFGGMTRHMLQAAELPVLMFH
jgi:nucleotide-binding universal stress UspA family protein